MSEKKRIIDSNQKLSLQAAVIIQCWYRKCKARLEVRRKCAWQVNQSLEYVTDESDPEGLQLILSSFGDEEDASKKFFPNREPSFTCDFNPNPNNLHFPIPEENFVSFLNWIKSATKIPINLFTSILNKATEFFSKQSNLSEILLVNDHHLIICGDLHGNLVAALRVFEEVGLPNSQNRFVFNGDFVDRGTKSVEVLSLLLMAVLTYPDYIFLNRGNHEDIMVNKRYGFVKELMNKYPEDKNNLVHLCDKLFCSLPIGAIINDKIFICHGGISKHTDLVKLKILNRFKLSSLLQPCLDGDNCVNFSDWQQVLDLLWSDPQDKDGCRPNGFRGAGCYFGPDVTDNFLGITNFSMIIRSHECFMEGWRISHSGKVLTIFSSFDYFTLRSNDGTYARVTGSRSSQTNMTDLKAIVSLYPTKCVSRDALSVSLDIYVDVCVLGKSEDHLCDKTLNDPVNMAFICLWQRIVRRKAKLLERFRALDIDNSGIISLTDWCDILASVTHLKLSWRCLRSFLVKLSVNRADQVIYNSMFTGNCVVHPDLPVNFLTYDL
ncbi:Serine/threonine-protein phosphatase with EF-hands 1 [Schistosoma japonicum]|uniref:Serine/threonine-protein phosphatase n=1 Tax=Schistosoma japonicum TaxID=6182 RepID=A0A4Z2DR72_SCHJA|nr:Serine/threonine-protein phosphatase with EF-hands 1 [Schistosoma japonicum]TNN18984.1 Serine/threonine-protein phosphatase with EF-hands 1 [Schistosoma japonicum]